MLDVDALGLDVMDRKLLRAVIDKFDGGPVGVDNLAAAIGEERDTIEDVLEPYLIQQGFLQRTPRGRIATARRTGTSASSRQRPRRAVHRMKAALPHLSPFPPARPRLLPRDPKLNLHPDLSFVSMVAHASVVVQAVMLLLLLPFALVVVADLSQDVRAQARRGEDRCLRG